MFNFLSPTLETEIKRDLASLERRITSAELNRITLDAHIDELYSKREYLTDRLSQLGGIQNESEGFSLSSKLPRTSSEFVTPDGTAVK